MNTGLIELFTCPRQSGGLRLTSATCAQMYRRAQFPEPAASLFVCRTCPIGAANAGIPLPSPIPKRGECLRCGRTGLRIIRGQICISCYNRERELLTGHYRRAKPPQKLNVRVAHVLLASGQVFTTTVKSAVEALLLSAKQFPDQSIISVGDDLRYSWSAECCGPVQLSFLPGA